YDPGTTCALVDRVFEPLARELPAILEAALEKQAAWELLQLPGPYPAARQQELCEALMRRTGYHFDHGRLDSTPHPFALGGVPGDQRITTRYKEDDLRFAIMATLHETGHSFYEFNLPRAWSYQPVGMARGASLHESQSLMLEMVACRTPQFVQLLAPMLAERFGPQDPAYSFDNLLKHYRIIRRNLIRIEADQVVYPLHIILRYELERSLLDGAIEVKDIPEVWREKMRSLIGLVPEGDADGCLQDVHWSFGMFGYFPSYGLGAAIAAQLFETAVRDDTAILDGIARGDFAPYFAWVRPRVHEKASSRPLEDIVREATGAPIAADALLRQLRQRYL
ncbi:MAG: carboxypeptidase M32, partial [Nevskiales bacterium]